MRASSLSLSTALAVFTMVVTAAPPASATGIDAGFDLWQTAAGTTVTIEVGAADLTIPLKGVPFGPGKTDTVVQRIAAIGDLAPPDGEETVGIELVALHLVSSQPVDLTGLGLPANSEVHAIINKGGMIDGLPEPAGLAPSIGSMKIVHTNDDGGTWESCFGPPAGGVCGSLGVGGGGIFAQIYVTTPGGDVNAPLAEFAAPMITLTSMACGWVHAQPEDDPRKGADADAFPAGGFFTTPPECHDGPHETLPATGSPLTIVALLGAAFVLAGSGLVGAARRRTGSVA